ncbi:hypothetical protein [Flavobacterium denitrificans]|uniref:hypothetical protein n=1 Tax=Flavobacterium denitrificans TaxID=281361 RepID=UPI00040B44A8|nr:hypothetical protein [Flavobacterium denitrificans]
MSKPSERFKKRKNAKELLQRISDNAIEYLIIHYSCESFYDLPEGNTPRITSIGVRYVKNAQTHSFSIHKIAELRQIASDQINQNYNDLEKAMLDEYFDFVSKHINHKWIHINMRNINYGFEAINHRYRVLGGNPISINDDSKIDLARLFIDLYGKEYAPHPRFESLYLLNNITMTDFLNGTQEAQAFVEGNYVGLHQSTLRKIDNMHNVLTLANEDDLKNKSTLFQMYGISLSGLYYMSKDNWIVAIIFWITNTIIATVIGIGVTLLISGK